MDQEDYRPTSKENKPAQDSKIPRGISQPISVHESIAKRRVVRFLHDLSIGHELDEDCKIYFMYDLFCNFCLCDFEAL